MQRVSSSANAAASLRSFCEVFRRYATASEKPRKTRAHANPDVNSTEPPAPGNTP